MDKIKLKRKLLILCISFILYSDTSDICLYEPNYEVLDEESDAYGTYSDGLIYIGKSEYLRSIINKVDEGDILVLDRRNSLDSDMQIIDSYKITNSNDIKDILSCLLEYERENPTNWNRTLSSMEVEWQVHNILYRLHYQRYRTDDVDLNNADENVYNNHILKKLF